MPKMLALILLALCSIAAHGQEILHHDLNVTIDPEQGSIKVHDTLRLPASILESDEIIFRLNSNLAFDSLRGDNYRLEPIDAATGDSVADAGREIAAATRYRLLLTNPGEPVTVSYAGILDAGLQRLSEEYAQSFSSTTGIISEQGVYLDHSSVWVPDFQSGLMSFSLDVSFRGDASDWTVVSQGASEGIRNHWQSDQPMEEIYLVAADFTTYSAQGDDVEMQAYLRTPDQNLATRYLDATERYLALYESMLGPYPFAKFALVENFWETGYGMPSFTLLGEQIIRFPFILESSYPHEILHNWWGNSVYPDYDTGNWSEGLTAYLADHLFQEMNGAGAEYRKDMLGRYRSFVDDAADFPLSSFTSRNSAASQAIGYGKTLMLWHMLRLELGDELFLQGLRELYAQRRFTHTSFDDIAALFSDIAGRDLQPFFRQWVQRSGAPVLSVSVSEQSEGGARITLSQSQAGEPYQLHVPVALYYQGQEEAQIATLSMAGKEATIEIPNYDQLQALLVDPYFDVFRRLDGSELPPTLREMFGASRIAFIVPQENREQWLEMAEFFTAGSDVDVQIINSEDFQALPADRAVWVLGRDNPAVEVVANAVDYYGVNWSEQGLSLLGSELHFSDRSTVLTAPHPGDAELTIGWIHAHSPAAMPGLTEKLPHYGKYSFLSFVGDEPANDVKGQWESPDSPLQWRHPELEAGAQLAPLPARSALAELPPKYLPAGLQDHVDALTAGPMQGRGIGSDGVVLAAQYIAEQFRDAGLEAADGQWLQQWAATLPDGRQVNLANVIGILPGTDATLSEQPIVLGAHYDHLGMEEDDNGTQVYPGADDNASGVSVLIEVARKLQKSFAPKRSILFVAFGAEESGLLGSRHFVENPPAGIRSEDIFAMINLDSIGRLEGRTLQVFASDSAYEWPFMAQGIGFTIGVPSQFPAQSVAGSDHVSFLEAGIPAIHLFSGVHADYHRPSDSADKLDLQGMSDIALWVEEAMLYLADREQPLRVNLSNAPVRDAAAVSSERSASLGTIPEFNYAGEGVQISGTTPGSAGEEAGLRAGDVLLQYNTEDIQDLQAYSNLLRASAPGDTVRLLVRRGDEMITVEAVLKAR